MKHAMSIRVSILALLAVPLLVGCDRPVGDRQQAGGCNSLPTEIPTILARISVFDDTVAQEDMDALAAEVSSLAARGSFADVCPSDLEVLGGAIDTMSQLEISSTASQARQDQARAITMQAWAPVLRQIDDVVYPQPDQIQFSPACNATEWDREGDMGGSGPPDMSGCTVLATTTRIGTWSYDAATLSGELTPGVQPTSFSQWERSSDDQGNPLQPSSMLLSQLGINPYTDIDYMLAADSSTKQFSAQLDVSAYQSSIDAAGHAYIIYGRNNAAAAYLLNPLAYVSDGFVVDYEYDPHRDSIKIEDCPADVFDGYQNLTFGTRQAQTSPEMPPFSETYAAQPGFWAVLAVCPANGAPTPPARPRNPTSKRATSR